MKSIVQLLFEESLNTTLLEGDLEEAAMTVRDAEANNLALFVSKQDYLATIVLYSPANIQKQFPKSAGGFGRAFQMTKMKNVIFGFMTVDVNKTKASKVISVAAQQGYGPLMYEIASNLFGWLTSDQDVKPGAEAVWQKFFTRKDVEKKFLKTKEPPNKGEWGLDVRPYPPKQDPLMYAYLIPKKMSSTKLMNSHKQFSSLLETNFEFEKEHFEEMLKVLGKNYFSSRV